MLIIHRLAKCIMHYDTHVSMMLSKTMFSLVVNGNLVLNLISLLFASKNMRTLVTTFIAVSWYPIVYINYAYGTIPAWKHTKTETVSCVVNKRNTWSRYEINTNKLCNRYFRPSITIGFVAFRLGTTKLLWIVVCWGKLTYLLKLHLLFYFGHFGSHQEETRCRPSLTCIDCVYRSLQTLASATLWTLP